MQVDEAIDIIKNEIDDFVIGDYCVEICEQKELCKDGECRFGKAIDTLITYVETMQKEFDRLEGIEDNTLMLKQELIETKEHNRQLALELKKKNKIIDLIADELRYQKGMRQDDIFCYDMCENEEGVVICDRENCKEHIKEYFYKKVSDNK